jgi:hypothetical protein
MRLPGAAVLGHPRNRYRRPVSSVLIRIPVSPDISQTITPRGPLDLIQVAFCPSDQASSNVHHYEPV